MTIIVLPYIATFLVSNVAIDYTVCIDILLSLHGQNVTVVEYREICK